MRFVYLVVELRHLSRKDSSHDLRRVSYCGAALASGAYLTTCVNISLHIHLKTFAKFSVVHSITPIILDHMLIVDEIP